MRKLEKRIGDLIIEAGLATRLQIDHALQAQKIFGDRLGTNLIELGVVDDDALVGFLARQFGVPRASRSEMENIPKEILDLIPVRAAERLCILPLAKHEDTLILVMMDPSEERFIHRVEERLGLRVECRIATEILIRYYMEKHYAIPRQPRHIHLMKHLDNKGQYADGPPGQVLDAQLDRHLTGSQAIDYYYETICTLDKVPVMKQIEVLTEYDLTPELTYVLLQIDGISSLGDLIAMSPFSRISTLRAMVHFTQLELVHFEDP